MRRTYDDNEQPIPCPQDELDEQGIGVSPECRASDYGSGDRGGSLRHVGCSIGNLRGELSNESECDRKYNKHY